MRVFRKLLALTLALTLALSMGTMMAVAAQAGTPHATIDFMKEALTGLTPGFSYSLGVSKVQADSSGQIKIPYSLMKGNPVELIQLGDGTTTDSNPQTITIPECPAAPTGIVATNATTAAQNDGKLSGLTTDMMYQLSTADSALAVTGSEVAGLTPGIYYIWKEATSTSFASEVYAVEIRAFGAAPTYPVTINVYKDDTLWTNHGMYVFINTLDGQFVTSTLPNGTYMVIADNQVLTDIVVQDQALEVNLNYYTVEFAVKDAGQASGSTISATYNGQPVQSGDVLFGGGNLTIKTQTKGATSYTYSWTDGAVLPIYVASALHSKINTTCTVTGLATAPTGEQLARNEAACIRAIYPAPKVGETRLRALDSSPNNGKPEFFTLSIAHTDKPTVIALDGTITPPDTAQVVALILTVTHTATGATANTYTLYTKVPAKLAPPTAPDDSSSSAPSENVANTPETAERVSSTVAALADPTKKLPAGTTTQTTAGGAAVTAIPVKLENGSAQVGSALFTTLGEAPATVALQLTISNGLVGGSAQILLPGGFGKITEPGRIFFPMNYANKAEEDTAMRAAVKGENAASDTALVGGDYTLPTAATVTVGTTLPEGSTANIFKYDPATLQYIALGKSIVKNGQLTFSTKIMGQLLFTTGTV